MDTAGEKFQRLVDIMARLRAPAAAPGIASRPSTPSSRTPSKRPTRSSTRSTAATGPVSPRNSATSSCRPSSTRKWPPKQDLFRIENALDAINEKLVRRHPHVFGDQSAETAGDVKRNWGEVKAAEEKEKGKPPETLLSGVPRALPALVEAQQIASRAAGVGFDWENPEQVIDKLHEELAEFNEARRNSTHSEIEDELGDMLFVIVNLARFVKVDPEQALRRSQRQVPPAFRLTSSKNCSASSGRTLQRGDDRRNGGALAGRQARR